MITPLDFTAFYALLERLPPIGRTDPRLGCIARTQIIGSLLHAQGLEVGRAWALPVYENDNFIAPIYDARQQPVRLIDPETRKSQIIRWRYHCATVLLGLPGEPIIDFPIFNGPVLKETWQNIYTTAQRHTPHNQTPTEIRFVMHSFADIPQRQVFLYNPQAEKQNKILPPRHLAKLATFPAIPPGILDIPFERNKGDYKSG